MTDARVPLPEPPEAPAAAYPSFPRDATTIAKWVAGEHVEGPALVAELAVWLDYWGGVANELRWIATGDPSGHAIVSIADELDPPAAPTHQVRADEVNARRHRNAQISRLSMGALAVDWWVYWTLKLVAKVRTTTRTCHHSRPSLPTPRSSCSAGPRPLLPLRRRRRDRAPMSMWSRPREATAEMLDLPGPRLGRCE